MLSIGDTLAHYVIRDRLGSGGMGEVFLAHDERLHRLVALKILSAADRSTEAVDRLIFEARAASALNHPNVAHIYEIGQREEILYIAMEYVEGVTLATMLERGPLPAAQACEIAVQLADALGEAYAKGIVHRDLKPANIVINQRGLAKILDFGIAKRMQTSEPLASARTTPNVVVGTLPYMSPEQVRGRPVDHRSDMFSFGTVLYEMVTGLRPFDGDSLLETMQKIDDAAPPPAANVDEALFRVISKCLAKKPEDRYQTPAALVADLRALQATPVPARQPRARMLVTVILVATAALIATILWRDDADTVPPSRLSRISSAPGLEDEPALSPDAQLVAYTSDERGNLDVYVRPVKGGEAVRVTDSDADDAQPAWSPDGSRIAFVSARGGSGRLSIVLSQAVGNFVNAKGGDLYVVPAAGGAAVRLVENAFYPAWSPDGTWIVFQSSRGGQWDLWKIPAAGGNPVQVTADSDFDYQPSWSPDGTTIVYVSGTPSPGYRLKVVEPSRRAPRVLTDGNDTMLLKPVFMSDGETILYSSARGGSLNLWRLRYGSRTAKPERVTLGEGDDVHPTVSRDGRRIVYASIRQKPDLWTYDVTSGTATQLTFDTGQEEFPHRSRDGVIAFSSDRGGPHAIWLLDPDGQMRQFAARPEVTQPRWSPDGRRMLYRFIENGITMIAVQAAGSTELTIIARDAETGAWSPDGRQIAFTAWNEQLPKGQIHIAPAGGGPARKLTSLDLTTSYPTFSPDAKFISFQATRDDATRHVWVVEVATGKTRQLTSGVSEDSHPQWSPVDPDQILFIRNHENLMSLRVSTGEVRQLTRYSAPNMVVDYPSWSPDGTRVDFSIAPKRGDMYLLESEE